MKQSDPAGPPEDAGSLPDAWVPAFVEDARREDSVEEFVRRVGGGILDEVPQVAADPLLTQEMLASVRVQWQAFLGLLAEDEYRHVLPAEAGHLARSLARRGHDIGVLLKVYRSAHQHVFGYVTEVTEAPVDGAPGRHEVLAYVWSRAGAWIDDSVEQLIETFYAERRRLLEGALARRSAVIEALLAGPWSADSEDPSSTLGHALQQHQTGFVLWFDDVSDPVEASLDDAAAALASALGAPRPLTHLAGTRDLWGWCATPAAPDLTQVDTIDGLLADRGLRLSVGIPARGTSGFRSSHAEARAAHRLVVGAVAAPRTVLYRDVELLCLAAGEGEALRRLVVRELGALRGPDKNLDLVRQTALAFLANRNVDEVAGDLFVHKNTVRYRLSRAEELVGHPLTERAAQVELALRYVALFGPLAAEPGVS